MVERWRPVTGKVYRIGDRLLRLLYVRRGEPTFEIEVHPLPIEWKERVAVRRAPRKSAGTSARLNHLSTDSVFRITISQLNPPFCHATARNFCHTTEHGREKNLILNESKPHAQ